MVSVSEYGGNLILLCFSFFILLFTSSSLSDTLLQGQTLKQQDSAELISAFQVFKLGFFTKRGNLYLGIWYNEPGYRSFDELTPVWVANRNTPILNGVGILTISSDGNLKLLHGGDPISVTSVKVLGNTSATLHDSGNLVLSELNSDGSVKRSLWQSFDHPTDTFLPGMKIGINLKTGYSWSLTSWTTRDTPASGPYSLAMDLNGTNQLIIRWAGDVIWTSGVWSNGHFNLSHDLSDHSSYIFSYISNENEKYFTYESKISFPMIVLDSSGSLVDLTTTYIACWMCRFYNSEECEISEKRVGCVDVDNPSCRKDSFDFTLKRGFVSGDAFKFNNMNLDWNDCRNKCLRNCSCIAFSLRNDCTIWSRVTIGTSSVDSVWQEIYIYQSKDNKWLQWTIIAVGGALVVSLLCYLIWRKYKDLVMNPNWLRKLEPEPLMRIWRKYKDLAMNPNWLRKLEPEPLMRIWRKCKEKFEQSLQLVKKINTEQEILLYELGINAKHNSSGGGKSGHELEFFSFESVTFATNNFSAENKLGEGGFGPVYKGKLADGQEIAIKRLSKNSRQGLIEFKNEVKVIAKLQHNNLVRLLGCCIEKEEKMLIYEYMPNKSLDFFLFDPTDKNVLDWTKRFNIIEGIAQGLLYLHKYSRLKIIHRDLKASNILLDSEMNPKISDFGMAKIFGIDESKANTNRVVGTHGYMPPEYAIEGICSTKSDVFSFGVLLLEIISGKKNNSVHNYDGPFSLSILAWELWRQDRGLELIDPVIDDSFHNEVLRCIHLALLCIQEKPIDRPTMLDVTSMIYNEAYQLPSPNQPAFCNLRNLPVPEIAEHKLEIWSLNEVSITEMQAR